MKLELGGYHLHSGKRVQFPLIVQPSIEQLMDYLSVLMNSSGVLVLSNDKGENNTPHEITLYADDKAYLVMLETMMEDGDIDVRTFYNGSSSKRFISILGEPYAEASIIKEFSLVIKAFKEFYEMGDVNKELLN